MQDSIIAYKADSLINNRRAEIDMAKVTSISGAYRVNGVTYYTIKNGDSLSTIAKKFHCSVKQPEGQFPEQHNTDAMERAQE